MYCLDVLSYKLDVLSYNLDVLSYKLDVLSYKLDVLSYNLDVLSFKLSYMLRQNNFASATCLIKEFIFDIFATPVRCLKVTRSSDSEGM